MRPFRLSRALQLDAEPLADGSEVGPGRVRQTDAVVFTLRARPRLRLARHQYLFDPLRRRHPLRGIYCFANQGLIRGGSAECGRIENRHEDTGSLAALVAGVLTTDAPIRVWSGSSTIDRAPIRAEAIASP